MSLQQTSDRTPPQGSVATLALLLPFLRPYLGWLFVAVLSVVAGAALVLVAGLAARAWMDGNRQMASLLAIVPGLDPVIFVPAACGFLLGAIGFVRSYTVAWLGERVTADVRQSLFDKVLSMPASFFETAPAGDVLSRLTCDTALIQTLLCTTLVQWTKSLLTLLGGLGLLILTSAHLAGIVIGLAAVVVLPLLLIARRERGLSAAAQDHLADLGGTVEETLNAIQTVQAYNHASIDSRLFAVSLNRVRRAALARARNRATLLAVGSMLAMCAIGFGVWFCFHQIRTQQSTGGDFVSFLFYSAVVTTSIGTLVESWGDMQRAAGAMERLAAIWNRPAGILLHATPRTLPASPLGQVDFAGVGFSYSGAPERPILNDFSVSLRAGQTTALVGASGAGKSTVLRLLMRLYEPTQGRILLDGIGLAELDPAELRRHVALVPQEPVIFGTSVRENIRYGRPDASDSEVEEAAEAAAAWSFIRRLPEGLDTFLGEKGVRLSGGQRQRLAIARAVLLDPAVLLLDEATSALDAESEQLVQEALSRLSVGRTTLIVAHRLATIRRADRILVLNAGEIVASDTHERLLKQDGLYRRLAALQFVSAAA